MWSPSRNRRTEGAEFRSEHGWHHESRRFRPVEGDESAFLRPNLRPLNPPPPGRGRRPRVASLAPLGQFTFCPHRPGHCGDGTHPVRLHGTADPSGSVPRRGPSFSFKQAEVNSDCSKVLLRKTLDAAFAARRAAASITVKKEHHYGPDQTPHPVRLHGTAARAAGTVRPDGGDPAQVLFPVRLHPPGHPGHRGG